MLHLCRCEGDHGNLQLLCSKEHDAACFANLNAGGDILVKIQILKHDQVWLVVFQKFNDVVVELDQSSTDLPANFRQHASAIDKYGRAMVLLDNPAARPSEPRINPHNGSD